MQTASSSASSFFTRERAASSLQDLDVVRKIVEREGCLEALAQLLTMLTTHAAAPTVVQSLLDQLRGVSVQIVEAVTRWKAARAGNASAVFYWRGLNYLLKMACDTDFVARHGAAVAQLDAFRGLRLTRNPFLAPLHLDHAALREQTPAMACRLARCVGHVDMARVFAACTALLREEEQHQQHQQHQQTRATSGEAGDADGGDAAQPQTTATPSDKTATTRLHWSHRPVALAPSVSAPSLPRDTADARALDVALATELVFQHEHELGAMKEELAVLQRRLADERATLAPDKARALRTRAAALNGDVQRRAGDLFHRRNELQRKQAVLRRAARTGECARAVAASQCVHSDQADGGDESPHLSATQTFQAALQADELRRHELVDRFASGRRLQTLETMTSGDVAAFVAALPLGDDARAYAARLAARGIDGRLLARARDRDLQELGVTLRLHRVHILEAVARTRGR